MANCLVLGANGFIGSHLVDELTSAGHAVRAFDRFSSVRKSFQTKGVEVFPGDFLNDADIRRSVVGQNFVFHFLSTTTPATAQEDPTVDVRTNVAQSISLLQSCVHSGVSRVYFASTGGAIYGNQSSEQHRETDITLPISPYGIGKLAIENYLNYFRITAGLESVILRISNPYGPRQRGNRGQGIIPIALRQILAGLPVVQLGDGQMVRDYIFVEDLVKMIGRMVSERPLMPLYNIGSGQGTSVQTIFATISRVLGHSFEIVGKDAPVTYVNKAVLNIERYTREFNFADFTPLEIGIKRTITALVTDQDRQSFA